MDPTWLHWTGFSAFVAVMLVLDLGVFHRKAHEPTLRESAVWTLIWCGLALAFNGFVWHQFGNHAGVEFLTGYLVEWSLSMDNVFVIAVIFKFFSVPLKEQYRVLFWGILGAVAMRLTFVLAGAALLQRFEWLTWIFGGILVYTGIKLAIHSNEEMHPDKNIILRLAKRYFPVTQGTHGEKFFVVENGRRCITPLFLVLLVIESTDVLFAVDSVPAIFSVVSRGPYFTFVVFTSNVFAILGLRALYFLLAGVMDMFRYLHYGLSAVLTFVGAKMIAESWFEWHFFKDYPAATLGAIAAMLGVAIGASLLAERKEEAQQEKAEAEDKAAASETQPPEEERQ